MCATRSPGREPVVAALVVLEHGPKSAEAAVAANIEALRPPKFMVDEATRRFAELGFRVSPCVGNSFSIEGPLSLFKTAFGAQLEVRADSSVRVARAKGATALELPLKGLPENMRRLVRAVTFSEPPAFGPGGTGP